MKKLFILVSALILFTTQSMAAPVVGEVYQKMGTTWVERDFENITIDAKHNEMINTFNKDKITVPKLKIELEQLIEEYKKSKNNSLKNSSEYIIERSIKKDNIYKLKNKINKIINNKDLNNYYLEVGNLLHDYYNNIDNLKTNNDIEVRNDIIKNDSLSRFAKILLKNQDLLMDDNKSLALVDSLKKMFNNQDFEKIIESVNSNIDVIESDDILIKLELLKAQSYGRLEGVKKYNELIKGLSKKYSDNQKVADLNKIISKLNRKWKEPGRANLSKGFKLIFVVSNMDFEKMDSQIINNKIKADLENANRVSFDVYDYQNKLLVIHDFKSKEKAENTALRIAKEIPELRLKNNFVALSSQYKNILIYKTLDLN